jgi:hypothetical protein
MNKKGFMQMPFSWMFGLIVGAIILALAIYAAIQLGGVGGTEQDVITSKDLGILLNPLEIGFETGKTTLLSLPKETRIYSLCQKADQDEEFGRQKFRISQKNFGKWSDTHLDVSFFNKYVFAPVPAEGKRFIIFSKPFEFPFKVADLTFIIPLEKSYCFVNAPENITNEIHKLKLTENIKNVTNKDWCGERETVCFYSIGTGSKPGCNTTVYFNKREIYNSTGAKSGYEGEALMYARIFSEHALYECQVNRLMKRLNTLIDLYNEKATFIAGKGCYSNLGLTTFKGLIQVIITGGSDMFVPSTVLEMQKIKKQNEVANCQLW